jgi:D-alanyl-D-alanine carboxypeptidase/D-alanyl-D-alanine-endopeptidase (penicillin-binding protein 4)
VPHAELASRAVAELWRESGGRLKGRVRLRAAADARALAPWTSLPSAPLGTLIHTMNKASDNLIARALFLSLVSGFPDQAATLPAARARMAAWLQTQRLAEEDILVDHGAGLSKDEQCRPRALVQLLSHAWRGPHLEPLLQSLPVAGVDGTLARRFTEGAARGRAFLKTGSANDTRALAGYVRCRSGRVQALAAFVHNEQVEAGTALLDGIVQWVAAHG